MELSFKNPQIVNKLFRVDQIKYSTWTYNERYNFYYDVILTENELVIIGRDIVSEHFLSKISSCGAYFGIDDEEYEENYAHVDFRWRYGDGGIIIFFSDWAGNEWRLSFNQSRFNEALEFFSELRNKTLIQGEDN